ncbi:Purine-binding protein precursor [compost metagenome]
MRAFGTDSDMSAYAPKAHLASAEINWLPYYKKITQDTLAGTWSTGQDWWGVKEGAMDLVSIADDVPQDLKDKVNAAKAGLKDGTFHIWKGPLKDNAGKELLAEGSNGDHAFLSGINFYVAGVDGSVPGASK